MSNSGFIRYLERTEEENIRRSEQLHQAHASCGQLSEADFPPIQMMRIIGSHNVQHFKSALTSNFIEFLSRGLVSTESNILDLGCGCGRLSLPFSRYLKNGRYYGVDVWPEGIEWCNKNIHSFYPNCQFYLLESSNNYYFETWKENVNNAYNLDFIQDKSIDFAFALSLFTHLREEDVRDYLGEIYRVLKENSVALLTGFIIDKYFWRFVDKTGLHRRVKEESDGCYHAYEGQDYFSGFTQKKWRSLLEGAELELISIELGRWANKPGARLFQDSFIVTRKTR